MYLYIMYKKCYTYKQQQYWYYNLPCASRDADLLPSLDHKVYNIYDTYKLTLILNTYV